MPDPSLLTRGKSEGVAIGPAGTFDLPGDTGLGIIHCEGESTLVVQVDMTGAANGDLTVAANPYEADNATISGVSLPVVQSQGPTLVGGHVFYYAQIDVTGVEAVRVRITNNNVGAQ